MQHPSIRVVRPEQFNSATAQTPGSQRLAAVYSEAVMESPMWGGLFLVDPGARTGIHHHGEQHTIAYVLSGSSFVRWGDRGEFNATLHAGNGRWRHIIVLECGRFTGGNSMSTIPQELDWVEKRAACNLAELFHRLCIEIGNDIISINGIKYKELYFKQESLRDGTIVMASLIALQGLRYPSGS